MLHAQQFSHQSVLRELEFSRITMLLVAISLFSATGCQSSQGVKSIGGQGPEIIKLNYNAVVLKYETKDLGRLFARTKNKTMSTGFTSRFSLSGKESIEPSAPAGKWSQARIEIVYPHPDGNESKGLATLIVSRHAPVESSSKSFKQKMSNGLSRMMMRASGTSSELTQLVGSEKVSSESVDEEVWQLNLPKEELDLLLSEFSHRGFFNKQERPRGEATVSITVDQGEFSKRWTSEPRLEDLMQQIYNQGELSAFKTQGAKIHSVSAIQQDTIPIKG